MKFLVDQDVYAGTVRFLIGLGHDVVTARQLGLAQAEDTELLRVAHEQGRIFVTRDRDFGALVFVQGSGPGIIYLRLLPSTQNSVHAELERILSMYSEPELQAAFVVRERGRADYRPAWPFPAAAAASVD
jgi:predicted nuclease of predicted toxin-antitoxin system